MNKKEILAMEGDALRQAVAEQIFGYTVELLKGFYSFGDGAFIEYPNAVGNTFALCYGTDRLPGGNWLWKELPNYPKDISAAWQVEKAILEQELLEEYATWLLSLSTREDMNAREILFALAHAKPENRCKAALLAKLEGGEK